MTTQRQRKSTTPSTATPEGREPRQPGGGPSNAVEVERWNQAEARRAAGQPEVGAPPEDFMSGGSAWGFGALETARQASTESPAPDRPSPRQDAAAAAKAAADTQFQTLLHLHSRALRLRDRTRSDMLRYGQLRSEGLGRRSEALETAARRANTDARVAVQRLAGLLSRLGDGRGGAKAGVAAAHLAGLVAHHRKALGELAHDADYSIARQRPETSAAGAARHTAGATATAGAAAAYGAATSLPFAGPVLDKVAGKHVRKGLVEAGTALSDRETATEAASRGEAIGVLTGSVAQMNGGAALQAANTTQALAEGTYAAATRKDLWKQTELSDAEVGLKVVAGGAAGMKALAGSSQAKMTAALARESGEAAPLLQQAARGLDTGSTLAQAADKGTAAATGHHLVAPEKRVEGAERVLQGVGAAAKVSSVADKTSSDSAWREAAGQSSAPSAVTSGLKLGEQAVRGGDAAVQLVTGQSIIDPDKEDAPNTRAKSAKTAGKAAQAFGQRSLAAAKDREQP